MIVFCIQLRIQYIFLCFNCQVNRENINIETLNRQVINIVLKSCFDVSNNHEWNIVSNDMFTMLTVNGNSETNRAAEEVLSKIETPDLYDQGILNQCYKCVL